MQEVSYDPSSSRGGRQIIPLQVAWLVHAPYPQVVSDAVSCRTVWFEEPCDTLAAVTR